MNTQQNHAPTLEELENRIIRLESRLRDVTVKTDGALHRIDGLRKNAEVTFLQVATLTDIVMTDEEQGGDA